MRVCNIWLSSVVCKSSEEYLLKGFQALVCTVSGKCGCHPGRLQSLPVFFCLRHVAPFTLRQWQPEYLEWAPWYFDVRRFLQIGNAPAMISTEMLMELVPRWDRKVRAIHADPDADKGLGWAQEMFAFTLALANSPGGPPEVLLDPLLLAQPPFDRALTVDMCLVCSHLPKTSGAMVHKSLWNELLF